MTPARSEPDRLESWKEIADYLGKGVTTVRRWEREEGLPVRRMEHVKRGSVVAFKSELDEWVRGRTTEPATEPSPPEASPAVSQPPQRWWVPATLALAAAFGLAGWLLPRQTAAGGALRSRPLTSDPGIELSPGLSPDGRQIAYEVSGDGIFVQPLDTAASPRRLTHGPDAFPRWSPDGSNILFTRASAPWLDFMFVPASGNGEPRQLLRRKLPATPAAHWEWASWMPDGKSLLLIDRTGPAEPWAVFRYDIATGHQQRLTAPPSADWFGDTIAAASPDGSRLAFVRFQGGSESDIYVMPMAGGEAVRLTHDASYHHGVAWTLDSRSLIYARTGRGVDLWQVEARRGAQPRELSEAGTEATWPSIGGSRLAFQRYFEVANIMRWDDPSASGARARPLSPSLRYERAAHYSSDGARVVFASTSSTRRGSFEIWTATAEGSQLRQITSMNQPFADAPRWSPDGGQIAFSNTGDGGNRDIYVVDAAGTAVRRLTSEPSEEGRPSWSRDGQWIYFRSGRTGSDEIWKQRSDGSGRAVQVTPGGGYEAFESLDGRWLYFTRDRRTEGLWRVPSSGGGAEELIAEQVREGLWSLANDAVYFVRLRPRAAIWRLAYGARAPTLLATIEVPPMGRIYSGFSTRADGRSFLFTRTTQLVADVMLIEGLR